MEEEGEEMEMLLLWCLPTGTEGRGSLLFVRERERERGGMAISLAFTLAIREACKGGGVGN